MIHGIKSIHGSLESNMKIVDGGIGKDYATISLTVPDNTDIDTEISFYGEVVSLMHWTEFWIERFLPV